MINGVAQRQGLSKSNALLPTPPTIPIPMSGVPPPLMPGMIPVAMIGSAAPVSFIATSATPLFTSVNLATTSAPSPVSSSSGGVKQTFKKMPQDMSSNSQEVTTTVFVGNITEHASDSLVRQILMKCGSVSSWKRVQGASGRLQAFGFCEYASPEAALCCMRILNGYNLGDKTLLVKVDSKTRAQLDDYKQKMKDDHADNSASNAEYDIELDENTKVNYLLNRSAIRAAVTKMTLDKEVLEEITELITGNSAVLTGTYDESLPYMKRSHSGHADNLDGLDMDNDKKDLVSKEIRSFRQAYRNDEDASKKDKDREGRDKDRERDRDRDRDKEREREKERRQREREERDKEYERRRERESRRRRDEDNYSDEEVKRSSRKSARDSETSERLRRSRSRSRDRDKEKVKEDEEDDDYERRRLERIKRDKDKLYNDRLKEFEARERKKMREYEKQLAKDVKRKESEAEERIHLKDFLEDYDDDRDDVKYYKGSALSRRMRDREVEAESDHRDKQREMEEIDEILRKRLADPSTEKENESPIPNRIKRERSPEKQAPQQQQQPLMKPTFFTVKNEKRSPSPEQLPSKTFAAVKNSPALPLKREKEPEEEVEQPSKKKTIGFGLRTTTVSQSNKKLESVFNSKDEEEESEDSSKKKLSKIDTKEEEEKKKLASADEKKKTIRNLIEKIPTSKEELFLFPIKMEMIDQNLVDKRIKPWVNKKIFEYIGEQEPTLVEFICSKVTAKSTPKNILEDVEMVLDEEAEVFVVKMWRLLIYETEAKHLGLVK